MTHTMSDANRHHPQPLQRELTAERYSSDYVPTHFERNCGVGFSPVRLASTMEVDAPKDFVLSDDEMERELAEVN